MGLTREDLEIRRTMVTATDQVALAGEAPSRGALAVYMDKVGPLPEVIDRPAAPLRIGHHMEGLALELLSEEHELVLRRPCPTTRHPAIAHLGATPDARVMAGADPMASQVGVAEAKFVGYRQAHKWGATPPDAVLIQVTQQMLVDRVQLAHIVALVGTDPRFYVVELDPSLAAALVEQAEMFWTKHVVPRIPPAPDASEASARALKDLYPRVRGDVFKASPEVEEIAREYFAAGRDEDHAADRRKGAENRLKALIGDHEGIDGDGWSARWTERAGVVSWKKAFDALVARVGYGVDTEPFRGEPSRPFRCTAK